MFCSITWCLVKGRLVLVDVTVGPISLNSASEIAGSELELSFENDI